MSTVLQQLINILKLNRLDDTLFQGENVNLGLPQVFGGQVIAQALSAALQVVSSERQLHSCHAYFLATGDNQYPIIYRVNVLREGRSFTAMQVNAIQHDEIICQVTCSFQKPEKGLEHQSSMPNVPNVASIPSELDQIRAVAQHIPEPFRTTFIAERPFEVHSQYMNNPFQGRELPPLQNTWVKTNGVAPIDLAIQQCLLAYFSDFHCLLTALHPHKKGFLEKGMKIVTIDHSIWFHRPFDMNDWLLYAIESNNAFGGRGLARGQFFDQTGRLIATTQQEGLIRYTANKDK